MIRFLADENVSRAVMERLRARGHDVVSVTETHSGTPDKLVLEAAVTEDRILITEDRDFGESVVRQRLAVSGVILLDWIACRIREGRSGRRGGFREREKLAGNLIVVEPTRVRIRP